MINHYGSQGFRENVDALIASGETGDAHIKVECGNDPVATLATLADEGPYAYTIHRILTAEQKALPLQIISTREAILDYYTTMHANVDILDWHIINQIRGSWYGFQHGIGDSRICATGELLPRSETVVLLPTFGKAGITGELYWSRTGVEPAGGAEARVKTFKRHAALVEAFRAENIDAIASAFTETCQTAVCDWVNESGTLCQIDGRDPLQAYYHALFAKLRVRGVDVVQRLVEDWFVFAELKWTFEIRSTGRTVTCYTAEFAALAADGRMSARIGHGTALSARPRP